MRQQASGSGFIGVDGANSSYPQPSIDDTRTAGEILTEEVERQQRQAPFRASSPSIEPESSDRPTEVDLNRVRRISIIDILTLGHKILGNVIDLLKQLKGA